MPKDYNHLYGILRRHAIEHGRKLCFIDGAVDFLGGAQ
jgi:hypothetical protein